MGWSWYAERWNHYLSQQQMQMLLLHRWHICFRHKAGVWMRLSCWDVPALVPRLLPPGLTGTDFSSIQRSEPTISKLEPKDGNLGIRINNWNWFANQELALAGTQATQRLPFHRKRNSQFWIAATQEKSAHARPGGKDQQGSKASTTHPWTKCKCF